MTNDQIIEIAKQFCTRQYTENLMSNPPQIVKRVDIKEKDLIAFARLIQQAQREEDARSVEKAVERFGHSFGHWSVVGETCAAAIRKGGAA